MIPSKFSLLSQIQLSLHFPSNNPLVQVSVHHYIIVTIIRITNPFPEPSFLDEIMFNFITIIMRLIFIQTKEFYWKLNLNKLYSIQVYFHYFQTKLPLLHPNGLRGPKEGLKLVFYSSKWIKICIVLSFLDEIMFNFITLNYEVDL